MDASDFQVTASNSERSGALARFPYDRDLVQRFREAFPRARWREQEAGWWVPGVKAAERVEAWITRELAAFDRHADERGRDALLFDPLPESPYLAVGGDSIMVRTPYAPAIVDALRRIPFAHWDRAARTWHVPFRSHEALRRLWPSIEAAAREAEPEARRRRREEREPDPEQAWWTAERRRRRYPLPGDDLPPLGEPVTVHRFGVVVFEALDGEVIGEPGAEAARRYPHVGDVRRHVWGHWRLPELREAVWRRRQAKRDGPDEEEAGRGWWPPTRAEIEERIAERRRAERAALARRGPPDEGSAGDETRRPSA